MKRIMFLFIVLFLFLSCSPDNIIHKENIVNTKFYLFIQKLDNNTFRISITQGRSWYHAELLKYYKHKINIQEEILFAKDIFQRIIK